MKRSGNCVVIIFIVTLFISGLSHGQTRVIYGKLTAYNSYPVKNITVEAKRAKSSVKTDSLGEFRIVCMDKDVIQIKPRIFESITQRVGPDIDSLEYNLVFIDNRKNREEVSSMGYLEAEEVTYALAHLEEENNDFCRYKDVFELIRGKFSGIVVREVEGLKGVYPAGTQSFHMSTELLYVLDGIEVRDISWLSPCEIRSIDHLKDSGAAMYGLKGGAGVIVIHTKDNRQE